MVRPKPDLVEWTCRGCGLTIQSHLRDRLYCSSDCSLLYRFTRTSSTCPLCGDSDPDRIWFWPTYELRTEAEQRELAFAEAHERCRRAEMDNAGRPTECECFECARARGEDPRQRSTGSGGRTRKVTVAFRRNRDHILERAGWICEICQLPIDRDAHPFHDRAPSVDHSIPVREGGSDDFDNLRASHRWCNIRREHPYDGYDQQILEEARTRFLGPEGARRN